MIRPVILSDLDDYLQLCKSFYSSTAVDHTVPISHFISTFHESINNSPYCHAFMVEYDNKTVGYGLVAITYSNEAGGLTVLLEELFILEEYRSKGLCKEFFAYIYSAFPKAVRYRLEVTNVNTRAIELYKKLGYKNLDYLQMYLDKDSNN